MLRVVLDTNIIVSGTLIAKQGHSAQILDAWRDGRFLLVISEDIIDEVKRTLNKILNTKAHKRYHLTKAKIGRLINLLYKYSILVPGKLDLTIIERDPDDNKFIIAAVEAAAQFIVSGDKDLLSLGSYQGIKIITPADFVKTMH